MNKTIYELPIEIEAVCRDLSAGILRRDPWARRIPGTTEGARRRERRALELALKAAAVRRRELWQAAVEPIYKLPVFKDGLSAQKANTMGRRVRQRATDAKPRPRPYFEPLGVALPRWGTEGAA